MFNLNEYNSIKLNEINDTQLFDQNNNDDQSKFPTIGLKSLLQNSDLLDLLLKPLKDTSPAPQTTKTTDHNQSFVNTNNCGNDEELKDKSSPDPSKIYGNAFFGQNLWDKNDLFQGDKLDVKFESIDFDEFLNETRLNESDVELLDKLQKDSSKLAAENQQSSTDVIVIEDQSKTSQTAASINNPLSVTSNDLMSDEEEQEQEEEDDEDDDLNNSSSVDLADGLKINKKAQKQLVPNELKDEKYWARRRKNNLAAKRSRDARRMKENHIAVRATFLEMENETLKKQLDELRKETKKFKIKLARYESAAARLNISLDNQEQI